jgi:lipase
VKLNVHEWGDPNAPMVICLHGITGHGRRFRKLAEERLTRYHVLAPDLRGHGRSGWDPPWTIEAHVDDLRETLPAPATWIGHSFGGRLLIELAAREPKLVERAVLLDPAIHVPSGYARQGAAEERAKQPFADVEEAIATRLESDDLMGPNRTPREFLDEEMREHLVPHEDGLYRYRYSHDAVASAWMEMAARPPAFDRVRLSTLLVLGAESKLVSAGELELYRSALGDLLEVAIVPGGHMVYWDAFDETAAAVERFLTTY